MYNSLDPTSFIRSLPLTMPTGPQSSSPFSPPDRMYEADESMTIVATSDSGNGSIGTDLRGTVEPDDMDGVTPLDVVKHALKSW